MAPLKLEFTCRYGYKRRHRARVCFWEVMLNINRSRPERELKRRLWIGAFKPHGRVRRTLARLNAKWFHNYQVDEDSSDTYCDAKSSDNFWTDDSSDVWQGDAQGGARRSGLTEQT